MPNPHDRRVIRTRAQLRAALMALIAERGYDTVNISDITERADLRRATFYLHYSDKESLLIDALEAMFDELTAQIDSLTGQDGLAGKTFVEAYQGTFRHVAQHRDLYRTLLTGTSAAAITRRVRAYLAGHVLRGLRNLPANSLLLPAEVMANYIAGAEVGLIVWWIESESPYSADEMAAMCHRLVLDGVRGLIAASAGDTQAESLRK